MTSLRSATSSRPPSRNVLDLGKERGLDAHSFDHFGSHTEFILLDGFAQALPVDEVNGGRAVSQTLIACSLREGTGRVMSRPFSPLPCMAPRKALTSPGPRSLHTACTGRRREKHVAAVSNLRTGAPAPDVPCDDRQRPVPPDHRCCPGPVLCQPGPVGR